MPWGFEHQPENVMARAAAAPYDYGAASAVQYQAQAPMPAGRLPPTAPPLDRQVSDPAFGTPPQSQYQAWRKTAYGDGSVRPMMAPPGDDGLGFITSISAVARPNQRSGRSRRQDPRRGQRVGYSRMGPPSVAASAPAGPGMSSPGMRHPSTIREAPGRITATGGSSTAFTDSFTEDSSESHSPVHYGAGAGQAQDASNNVNEYSRDPRVERVRCSAMTLQSVWEHFPGMSHEDVGELTFLVMRLASDLWAYKSHVDVKEWGRVIEDLQDIEDSSVGISYRARSSQRLGSSYAFFKVKPRRKGVVDSIDWMQ